LRRGGLPALNELSDLDMKFRLPVYLFLALAWVPGLTLSAASAAEPMEIRITIKGHRFEPERIEVPAGQRLKLVVTNADATPEEFESKVLRIERVILGGQSATFNVRPLNKGQTYKFFGEFHEDTAQGVLIAK
jgi:Cupredoxin-like domain